MWSWIAVIIFLAIFGMFAKNFYFRSVLKTPEGFKADFIEWGLGYSFYKLRNPR